MNILIVGVGGQGNVLASKILCQTAILEGQKVLSAETIGMAQRGGSVVSHVRTGSQIYSPLIPKGQADLIIAFEAAEAVRSLEYLKDGGCVVVNKKVVQPVTASLNGAAFVPDEMIECLKQNAGKVIVADCDTACRDLGSSRVANMVLLGAACGAGFIKKDNLIKALEMTVKPDFIDINIKAINYLQTDSGL